MTIFILLFHILEAIMLTLLQLHHLIHLKSAQTLLANFFGINMSLWNLRTLSNTESRYYPASNTKNNASMPGNPSPTWNTLNSSISLLWFASYFQLKLMKTIYFREYERLQLTIFHSSTLVNGMVSSQIIQHLLVSLD